jgi:hypothetical protein
MKKLRSWKLLVPLLILIAGILWWTISPLFINTAVDDALDPEIEALLEDNATNTDAETTLVSGPFPIVDTPTHPATGVIRVIERPEQRLVRFENYDGTNGPDLRVYLATDLEATEFIDLGRAKGNQGNINYEIPSDVNIADYQYVMTWCRAFGVLFDYAEIQ